jgi:hypothetical protein
LGPRKTVLALHLIDGVRDGENSIFPHLPCAAISAFSKFFIDPAFYSIGEVFFLRFPLNFPKVFAKFPSARYD